MRILLLLFLSLFAVQFVAASDLIELDNGLVAVSFSQVEAQGSPTEIHQSVYRYIDGKKVLLPSDDSVQGYYVFDVSGLAIKEDKFYSYWIEQGKKTEDENKIWSLFESPSVTRLSPTKAIKKKNKIILMFDSHCKGKFSVIWQLAEGARHFDVTMNFEPTDNKKYVLGYKLFMEKDISEVNELLLPMMWQRKRFPDKPYTLFDNQTPTPVSLIDFAHDDSRYSYSITANPETLDFKWPNQLTRTFGLSIRNEKGLVNPSICGPFDSINGQKKLKLGFKVTVDNSDWYSTFRYIADDIYALKDYRANYNTNLTESVFNMIDLMMDDDKGGWWPRAKAFYQIESLNGSTQPVPLVMLSLYYLTADADIYKRRTLPTLEFVLSRSSFHFSPEPENTGHYDKGKMAGPIRQYGTTVYSGAWEMTNRLMPVFRDIAFEKDGIKATSGYTHAQEFEEWLVKYQITGQKESLDKACDLANKYIAKNVLMPADKDLGIDPFFLIHFISNWEGLLRMYEVTGEKEYLDAACYGANLLTTGIWTQPVIPQEDVTVHKGNVFEGDIPNICMRKGPGEFRLGYDQDPVTPRNGTQINPPKEKDIPSWLVSNVGLGFEQPSTVFHPLDDARKARLIYQTVWAPNFLRLAHYAKNDIYEKYARNAVLGRWSNYPGYYATGFTDCPNDESYPFVGPDISCIYYHHIPVHLGWTIDYLITDAHLASNGKVNFPSQRQNGYAYFDMRVYGDKPGEAFGEKDLWLWFKKGLLNVSNIQVNYITAHSNDDLYVILVNQSKKKERVKVVFNEELVRAFDGRLYNADSVTSVKSDSNAIELALDSRRAAMLKINKPGIDFPDIHCLPETERDLKSENLFKAQKVTDQITLKACSVQLVPDFWSGYVWLEAKYGDIKHAVFYCSFDGKEYKQISDDEYPFEFSTDIEKDFDEFCYFVEGIDGNGNTFSTKPSKVFRGR